MNPNIFNSSSGPATTTLNEAGGTAYDLSSKASLAQIAATGTFQNTFYASGGDQLETIKRLITEVEPEFVAKVAIYARKAGHMKDTPAFLLAALSVENVDLVERAFGRVIDNGKMLRNFVQVIRSGVLARKSFGSALKRLIQNFLLERPDFRLFKDAVGGNPSVADIINMVHPKPTSKEQGEFFAYLIGKKYKIEHLPSFVSDYERFKATIETNPNAEVPNVEFRYLTSLPLTPEHWKQIARNAPHMMLRMNINTFYRHGVFEDKQLTTELAQNLRNPEIIKKARQFPYQYLTAFHSLDKDVPEEIKSALQDALDHSLSNVPTFGGKRICVFPDISGSMSQSITGNRGSSTSVTECRHVAALFTAALLRQNPDTIVCPFGSSSERITLNPRDSVATITKEIDRQSTHLGWNTNYSNPIALLNNEDVKADVCIWIGDEQSWCDSQKRDYTYDYSGETQTYKEFARFQKRNPGAKAIHINLQPHTSTQAPDNRDILNIGGFSDQVFKVVDSFVNHNDPNHWVDEIENIAL